MAMMFTSKKNPLFLPLLAFITYLVLLHKVNSTESVDFNIPKFDQESEKDLIFQGDASIIPNKNILQLTKVDSYGNPLYHRVGRVLYSKPVHLWSSSESWAADFTTSFTFRITSLHSNIPADGITFFIASQGTAIPPDSDGGLLGLFANGNALNNSHNEVVGFKAGSDKVVAVEFDTYTNENYGDPSYMHVGVDVNSIRSKAIKEWNWVNGDPVAVTINYDPYGNELRVVASDYSGSSIEVIQKIDFKYELPEWVRVGLSSSTGENAEINDIINWSFHSNLGRRSYVAEEGYIASVV